MDGTIKLGTDTVKAMLVTSGYTFNPDHHYVADVNPGANELSGTGYTGGFGGSGRKALANMITAEDDAGDRGYFDADDLTWSAITAGTAAAVILFKPGTSDADSVLIGYIDTGGFPKVTNGGDLVVQFSSSPLGVIQST